MNVRSWVVVFIVFGSSVARGQFSAAWLQDEKYCGDGKAEFNRVLALRHGRAGERAIVHEHDPLRVKPQTSWEAEAQLRVFHLSS